MTDSLQSRISEFVCNLDYEQIPSQAVHAAKACLIDTLGALISGFHGEPCRIARDYAARSLRTPGVTVVGTHMTCAPEIAAFVNATTARYAELTDIYHLPGSSVAHPSDAVTPVLAAAEYMHADGRKLITAIVAAYEVSLQFAHHFKNEGFDNTNLGCLGAVVGAGKLMGLPPAALAHALAIAMTPNVVVKQARRGKKTMFKAVASGYAARAGVFAALLARAGMEGPNLPFEGKAGWCEQVGGGRFTLPEMGGTGFRYKIVDTRIKNRPAAGPAIASILAAEKLAPLDLSSIRRIVIEVHQLAKNNTAAGQRPWPLETREDADHSTPYLIVATLRDGTISLASFDDAHIGDTVLRNAMQLVEVVVNPDYTRAYESLPQSHHARLTVFMNDGRTLVAQAGGDADDLASPRTDVQIEQKFRQTCESFLGGKRVDTILHRFWRLEAVEDSATLAPLFAFA